MTSACRSAVMSSIDLPYLDWHSTFEDLCSHNLNHSALESYFVKSMISIETDYGFKIKFLQDSSWLQTYLIG